MSGNPLDVVVVDRVDHAPGIAVFELERHDGSPLPPFDAGAHIDVDVGGGMIRQYSLCGVPGETTRYRIGVLNDPASRGGSRAIHRNFTTGVEVRISPPRNHFPLDVAAERTVLIGGGIGITPMIAMSHALKAATRPFELHYCGRSRAQVGFLDELAEHFAAEAHFHFDDEPEDRRFIARDCLTGQPDGTHVYVCGPSGFMDWVIASAREAGYPDRRIHFEYFGADVDTHGAAFEVVAGRSGLVVPVGENTTIIEALAAAGIKVRKSCEQGVCGTCLCDVIEGVPDHKDKFLTEDEKAANDQIVVCCSRSKTPRLVLDI